MTKQAGKLPLKMCVYVIFFLFVYVLQASVFSKFTIHGAKPTIFPLVVVCAAMFEGSVNGGLLGLAAGMMCDISYNQPTIQFTLILMLLGIIAGILSDTFFARGFPTYLMLGIFSVIISAAAQAFGFFFLRDIDINELIYPMLYQCLYSLIFLLPVYLFVRRISRILASY